MRKRRHDGPLWLFVMVLFLMSGLNQKVWACRQLEPPVDRADTLWVHLEGPCLPTDQRAWAVKGGDVLEALEAGKNLDLQGALVIGDIMLDQLPVQPVAEIPNIPADIQERLQQRGLEAVRVIQGAVTIRDSRIEQVLATNLESGALVILGEVNMAGTTFLQSVDFSKIIFAKPLVFTNVQVEYEGFFIGAHFDQAVDFSHTNFGTHSRFHKAVFGGPVLFVEVEFKGVAEFLEVEFQQTANFSQAKFLSGTGFSGSIFHGPVDFSGVRAKQEIYFRFSEFKKGVSFRHGRFQSVVDFSNSHFEGEHDFSEAEFAVQPEFTASNISVQVPISGLKFTQQSQWLLFGGLVILAGIYLWISKRSTGGHSA